jgi:hypothetical protein
MDRIEGTATIKYDVLYYLRAPLICGEETSHFVIIKQASRLKTDEFSWYLR